MCELFLFYFTRSTYQVIVTVIYQPRDVSYFFMPAPDRCDLLVPFTRRLPLARTYDYCCMITEYALRLWKIMNGRAHTAHNLSLFSLYHLK